jgi:hypothetical protein
LRAVTACCGSGNLPGPLRDEGLPNGRTPQTSERPHPLYVIKRDGQDDYWLNVGIAFPHKDGKGFNIMLQAFPLDGKIVCREISGEEESAAPPCAERNDRQHRRSR